jgi:hypothetical protein
MDSLHKVNNIATITLLTYILRLQIYRPAYLSLVACTIIKF